MKKKLFFSLIFLLILSLGLFWRQFNLSVPKEKVLIDSVSISQDQSVAQSEVKNSVPAQAEDTKKTEDVKVPFTSQAPLANWSDERFQNGCEEASVVMAMRWIQNKPFSSPTDAQQEIVNIGNFEEKTFGNFIDASAQQVGQILSQFYNFNNFTIKNNPTLADLKTELAKGNIILVPAFGQALKNPNFTKPGPITHMLVVVGYDEKTKEFITNDPGTKKGQNYRYNENVLFDAVWAYPAGKIHPDPPKNTSQKVMLVVLRNVL